MHNINQINHNIWCRSFRKQLKPVSFFFQTRSEYAIQNSKISFLFSPQFFMLDTTLIFSGEISYEKPSYCV